MCNFRNLRRENLLKDFFGPFILSLILVLWYYLFNISFIAVKLPYMIFSEAKFILWVDTLGLFLITFGAILAIRPLIRGLLNPRIRREETRRRRDRNAGLIAFVYILVGFALQFTSKVYYLINAPIYFLNGSAWPVITLAITIIAYLFIIKRYKEFNIF